MKQILFQIIIIICCNFCIVFPWNNKEKINQNDSLDTEELEEEIDDFEYLNSVRGHKEEELITGNFTGLGIDTLYVEVEEIDSIDNFNERYKFYAKSNNPEIPTIEMFGCGYATPWLVYEGDVDGDGKDEWGYLHTWITSEWRYYRIYNYDNTTKRWRFLYSGDLLSTPQILRESGLDIVEKGPQKGLIKINYYNWQKGIRDTIVQPTYTTISTKNR